MTDLLNTIKNCGKREMDESIIDKAAGLVKSVVNHAIDGFKTSDDLSKERLAICAECPFFIKESVKCSKCGCWMKTKSRWKTATCPIGAWPK